VAVRARRASSVVRDRAIRCFTSREQGIEACPKGADWGACGIRRQIRHSPASPGVQLLHTGSTLYWQAASLRGWPFIVERRTAPETEGCLKPKSGKPQ